ncbi:MAG TPA: histidine kinase dimerization/phospho-acceptor domain-containing protein [Luteitalea sp.]|nr:histidine kinase dimerization/phospho-acceptor domain-containing protein [Luteitalea sp.]
MRSPGELVADLACRRTLDHIAAPIRIWVPGSGVVFVNQSWRDLTGTTLEDNTGDGWLRCVHEEDRGGAQALDDRPAADPASGPAHDYRLQGRDGQPLAMSDRPSPWTDETTQSVLGVIHTLTPRSDVGSDDRSRTMSKWAHELRGPLNAILGWSDLLSAGDSPGDVVQRGLKAIANNARQQAQIIKRMTE